MAKAKHKPTITLPQIGNMRTETVVREVANPLFSRDHAEGRTNPRQIAAIINIRESAVETLFSRGSLDEAQKRAADRFRMIWERLGGAGAGAMDYSKDVVGGGKVADPISVQQMEAGRELNRCRQLLGARNYDLVCSVCGEGRALGEVGSTKRDRLTAADVLRHCLDDLCELWDMKTRRR